MAIVGVASLALFLTGCRPKEPKTETSAKVIEEMSRGVSQMGQYNYDEAVRAFETVLQVSPDLADAKVNLAIAHFNRAKKEQQDVEKAQALLDSLIQTDPENVRAHYFKAIVLQHLGQAEQAITHLEKVLQQRPNDGVAWYILGLCRQRAGQDARKELSKAVELRPYLASAYYKLWQIYQAAGQSKEAAPYMEKFKQLRENPLSETIELPQYNQMGDLALALPMPARNQPPITKSEFAPQEEKVLATSSEPLPSRPSEKEKSLGGLALGDFNGDGRPDMITIMTDKDGRGRLRLLLTNATGRYTDATAASGLDKVLDPVVCAVGDFDNDENTDLFVAGAGASFLFKGQGEGRFADVTAKTGIVAGKTEPRCAAFVDADHDGDLDLFVGYEAPGGNQLWNNNADGSFVNIAEKNGVLCGDSSTTAISFGDVDSDRDTDLVLLQAGRPARLFLNDLLGTYHEASTGATIEGDLGGMLQDFNGDGFLDLLAFGGKPAGLHLYPGDERGHFHRDEAFEQCAAALGSWGEPRGFRAADIDLDGDLDIVVVSKGLHALLNDGTGKFVFQPELWKSVKVDDLVAAEVADLNGDFVPDLLKVDAAQRLVLVPGMLTPPSTALSVTPTGVRGRDKRTRCPASGYGVSLTLRAGMREQRLVYTGFNGGPNQSQLPVVFGLGGAPHADYLHLWWTDAVAQDETLMKAGQHYRISEMQRKISSCPVLFTWNGTRYECITDFAGVGGLGYFSSPGEYAPPQALEHVKIEPGSLQPRDGVYEVRLTEPMEEAAYIDRLELRAIDHPADMQVYPDERLAVTGPLPTRELLVVSHPYYPTSAIAPSGKECAAKLRTADRDYAYEPELDRRFFGFCKPHSLEVDFGDQLAGIGTNERLFLFINGFINYPYSQTSYAAGQAKIAWEAIKIERLMPDGQWKVIVPDAGAFGGIARMIAVDMSGLGNGALCRLRLTTNLEIFYDQIFMARDVGPNQVTVRSLPVADADLRHVGFAHEFSPDGKQPLIYDYDLQDATAPFHVLKGAYTRYGSVKELLNDYDDRYAIMAPGDEIAARFDGSKLPALQPGWKRSFILVSHAYCKDMDLYTGTPVTLEPLPFKGMSKYPYPKTEHYPDTKETREYRALYNTRIIE